MLTHGKLSPAFDIYWDDMDRCRKGGAYWSLLHVTVCLPDICAALQSDDGETNQRRYVAWCDEHLHDPLLSGAERYRMRCKVLHQGRATVDQAGRYGGFSFAQPATDGQIDHKRLEGNTFILDVGRLSEEARLAVGQWICRLEANLASSEALNVERNLPTLVRVRQFPLPTTAAMVPTTPPTVINRSS